MKIPPTPYLSIDKDVLEKNILKMAKRARSQNFRLRPHVKTHKIPQLAKLQLAAGASGITVATIGEAEVFAKHGLKDIFIAYPLWVTPERAKRLNKLQRRVKLTLAIDSMAGAKQLAELGSIDVLVEIDSGHHRSGCEPEAAGSLASAAKQLGLQPKGIFTFPGHSYNPIGRASAVRDETKALKKAIESFSKAGLVAEVVSSGSTPTAMLTSKGIINELRPGVYVFNDAQQIELGSCSFKDVALWANATVVSGSERKIIVDAGSKILGADRALWASGYGRLLDYPDARITAISEHHATIHFPKPKRGTKSRIPGLGSIIRVVPNHVCNCVNLVDKVYLVSKKQLVGNWKVSARGKNS